MAHDIFADPAVSHPIGDARWSAKAPVVRVRVMRLVARAAVLLVLSAAGRLGAQDTGYVPATDFENGRQVVAIYFGANWCHPCRTPEMKAAIRAIASAHLSARRGGLILETTDLYSFLSARCRTTS